MRIVIASLCFVAFAAGSAAAQEERPANPQVLDQVYACANIADETQRLACYDGAVGRLRDAQTSGNLVAVDRQQAQEIEREAFGFSLPSLPRIFGNRGNEAAAPEIAEMALTIDRVVTRRNGPATFYMSNGQVWTQIDDENARNARAGGQVTIRRATLGSFLMSVEAGGPAIRVRRTQ
ncbi:MAG TPA: hypothetical protein VEA80_11000 [Vitreimonas sp.]|uniref:hypothetical protein n=1 Tax=Vitreimonas sp. TaxID=3069702 RepID=UPI002D452CE1|nr:hypothetical protein [Vitreimonas sp.]HYD87994.1 hypothetical protein [Vitreimonas sp.]